MRKILYNISDGYPDPNVGGGNRIIYELISSGLRDEFKLSFFSYLSKNIIPVNSDPHNDFIKAIRIQKQMGRWLFDNISLYKKIMSSDFYRKKYFNRIVNYISFNSKRFNSFDIVHSHDTLSAKLNKSLTVPKKILSIHSKGSAFSEIKNSFKNPNSFPAWITKMKEIEKENYFNSDLVVFPSKAAENYFLSDLNISEEHKPNTAIVYNGIDKDKIQSIIKSMFENIFYKYGIVVNAKQLRIINVAEHVPEKNIKLILEAIAILNFTFKKDAILINIGQGILTDKLKKMSAELNISNKIFFIGHVRNVDIIWLINNCDFLIMPGEKVIFDLVILEALAVGTSVITSKIGGNTEIIQDGSNGYFIDPLSSENVAELLTRVTPGKTRENGFKTVEKFSKANMIKRYKEIYQTIVDG
jgi:glycosyltransferase involved in cell wall biosynthesis